MIASIFFTAFPQRFESHEARSVPPSRKDDRRWRRPSYAIVPEHATANKHGVHIGGTAQMAGMAAAKLGSHHTVVA
jgi:hypothetical protein